MIVERKSNKTTIIIWGIATVIIVSIIIIVDLVMFFTNKGLYGKYNPPPPPEKSVSPNGNPNAPNSGTEILLFNPSLLQSKSGNLTGYNASSAQTNPAEWGYYLSSNF